MTSDNTIEIFEHDTEFWMEDGNLVLLAGKVAFRVYRGLLAMQSPVFASMFLVADSGASKSVDGCPAVCLSDSPEDLRHLLRALLPSQHRVVYIPNHTEKYSDFYQLSSLVRLGHKYQIEDVQNQALAALQRYFVPLTFEDLDRPDFHNSLYRDACGIELVHLARLTDNPTMLPIAFYACVSFGSDVVDGWRREDGTIQHLGPGDLKRCFEAYAEIALRKAPMTKRIFDVGPSLNCQSPELCATELQDTYPVIFPAIRLINGWSDVIHDYYGSCICRACAKMLEERGVAERRAFWKDLATIFRL